MRFIDTPLKNAFEIIPQVFEDARGFFTRTFSQAEMAEHGCNAAIHECNVSSNLRAGTLRGMHYQADPYAQSKLVRCTAGTIWDCIIDLRRSSSTFKQWYGVELSAGNHKLLYIPEGFAHGFVTLADSTEVFYQMGNVFHPASARGVRWNDPAFGIEWPIQPNVIHERDAGYGDFVNEIA